ncbi:glutaminase A [Nocardia seriolae]|uniref:glutaminase A n=1 Tax=Nocardia seriolae TaxID=37332 RepID=UPI00051A403F|nr:glutaminase A [Nocardia seriolae]MTJ64575.1 glutaminase A [Nocardia seriolae]MTJ73359.1 glutaminase A [Nocardia seriolae]MTJ89418.1 glutaminase A [Nocardia seriolae]MTK33394.1 glutaminase A [Nocardia seriolae]MTK42532.1 glutaminase A [Nocardia seriolae]
MVPSGGVVARIIDEVYELCRADTSGTLADYIPELAAVQPDSFGICLATADGRVYGSGDLDTAFTIQSISKPFTYALALADRGPAAVAERIDVEPSGEPFAEISLDPVTQRPRNPMINAGAIAAASLIEGTDAADRFARIRRSYSRFAGRELSMNEAVYASEARTGYRNRAIGYLLRGAGIIDIDPDEAVDRYFRQCSIDVTCRDLALMAATLANNGVNPLTRERALTRPLVEQVLSVMTTCGMYDSAGDWVTTVGLPAKSGVGGGILAVLPGQIGIAVHSPRLDAHGSSVRGVKACRELSNRLGLHFLHVTRAAHTAIRAAYSVADAPSRLRRDADELAVLHEFGDRARIFELHGDLLFAGAESTVRTVEDSATELEALVLDLREVGDVSPIAVRMFDDLEAELAAAGCRVALVDPDGKLGHLVSSLVPDDPRGRVFIDRDAATEWCEQLILDAHRPPGQECPAALTIDRHPALADMPDDERALLAKEFETRTIARGELIVARDSPRCGLFLILDGRVRFTFTDRDRRRHRLITLTPGMSFGETSMLASVPYANDVYAETTVRVAVLPPARFDRLTSQAPQIKLALLERLAAAAYTQADAAVRAVAAHGGI